MVEAEREVEATQQRYKNKRSLAVCNILQQYAASHSTIFDV